MREKEVEIESSKKLKGEKVYFLFSITLRKDLSFPFLLVSGNIIGNIMEKSSTFPWGGSIMEKQWNLLRFNSMFLKSEIIIIFPSSFHPLPSRGEKKINPFPIIFSLYFHYNSIIFPKSFHNTSIYISISFKKKKTSKKKTFRIYFRIFS